ncbi:unnamed protein product [Mytilus edulis]|uniref:C3H1-type domain-containing protein n=1 Tax=Mytilus edulis TaxID=6550 RepID=A0A8S3QYR2_MYTED|nr:unnamed protein product [Mytilus edulis]
MASTREKRDNAGDKLKDIIDSLKPKATKQKETHDNNEDSDSESDGEFAESFEKLTEDNDNEEINALENELKRLKTEKRKVEFKRKIEEEKDNLKNLQLLPTVQPSVAALVQKILQKLTYSVSPQNMFGTLSCSMTKSTETCRQEKFTWGTYRQDLRDFQLVSKRENPTTRAMNDATKPHGKQSANNDRRRGPFLPDGREICRNFNNNSCYRQDCRMMHHCAICMSSSHSAISGHGHSNHSDKVAKNPYAPQN